MSNACGVIFSDLQRSVWVIMAHIDEKLLEVERVLGGGNGSVDLRFTGGHSDGLAENRSPRYGTPVHHEQAKKGYTR